MSVIFSNNDGFGYYFKIKIKILTDRFNNRIYLPGVIIAQNISSHISFISEFNI